MAKSDPPQSNRGGGTSRSRASTLVSQPGCFPFAEPDSEARTISCCTHHYEGEEAAAILGLRVVARHGGNGVGQGMRRVILWDEL